MKNTLATQKEGYEKIINDSVASIIMNAKKIVCELQSNNPDNKTMKDSVKIVNRDLRAVIKYLFFDEENFKSDDVVYGVFQSWVCYKFILSKKKIVYLEMDFGLRKWRLLDKDKNQLCTQDMKKNNMQFLRLTRLIFPEDKILKILKDNLSETI